MKSEFLNKEMIRPAPALQTPEQFFKLFMGYDFIIDSLSIKKVTFKK
jgi:hypothetical protein